MSSSIHGDRKGGGRGVSPLDSEIISKKGCFFNFEGWKPNFTTLSPPGKNLEKSLTAPPLEKILPTPKVVSLYLLQHNWKRRCFKMFQVKRGANKRYWWVISGKCLQDKYQKYNFIGEDCKGKCWKTWTLVQNVKSMTTSTLKCKFVLRVEFIVKAWCSISSDGLIHYNWQDEMFRYKK